MDKKFFSTDNFNLINNIVNVTLKKKYDINTNQSFKNKIIDSMKYVYSNVSPQPPRNISYDKYLDMMNIKCISIIVPNIVKELSDQRDLPNNEFENSFQASQQPSSSNSDYHQNYDPKALPLPQNSNDVSSGNVSEQFEELQNDRQAEIKQEEEKQKIPHPQPVQVNEIPPSLENTNKEFNRRLQERNVNFNNLIQNDNQVQPVQNQMHKVMQEQVQERVQDSMMGSEQNQSVEQFFPSPSDLTNETNMASVNNNLDESFVQKSHHTIQQYKQHEGENNELNTNTNTNMNTIQPVITRTEGQNVMNNPDIVSIPEEHQINRHVTDNTTPNVFHPNNVNNIDPVIYPYKPQYVKKVHFFTIDSRDRDLEIYPNPSYFQVKFSPATDDIITKTVNVRTNIQNVLYVIREDVSGERGATIPRDFDNIYYIQNTQTIVPLESTYVCGICPNRYYDNSLDSNCIPPTTEKSKILPIKKYSYRPIWNNKIGIQSTVLDVPYLLLNIKELESYSPYVGTNTPNRNAFAKLVYESNFGEVSPYIKMLTSETDEYYLYSPTALGKLDKMTLFLSTPEGNPFFFGRDKLFIDRFEMSPNYMKNCPSGEIDNMEIGINATRVYINTDQTFCACTKNCNCNTPLKSHCLKPGDLIYFYNTKPCKPVYIMFHDPDSQIPYNNYQLIINEENDTLINLSINIMIDEMQDEIESIDFSKFLSADNYLTLLIDNKNEFYKILEVDQTNVTLEKNGSLNLSDNIIISKVGYAKKNNKGFQSNDKDDLTYDGGVRVCNVGDSISCMQNINQDNCDPNCDDYDKNNPGSKAEMLTLETISDPTDELYFDIDIPFDNISPELLEDNYKPGQVFLIKQKLQINYTFKVVTLEKDYNILESHLVGP